MIQLPTHIEKLAPYKVGKPIAEVQKELGLSDVIKLASNENPLGPSPKALARLTEFAADLHYYPNGGADLREVLASHFSVGKENVLCASGSESVLQIALKTFLAAGDELLSCSGTFVGYQVLANATGNPMRYVPLTTDYRFDLSALADALMPATKIVYIANPNNPTGTYISREEFDRFYEKIPQNVLIILDEAYFEYSAHIAPDYPDSLHYRYDNVLTLRTFSKCYGIAGVRIGYGVGSADVIGAMLKVKLPFEPNTLAQSAALGALGDTDFLRETVELNKEGLAYFERELSALNLRFPHSIANFVMIDCGTKDNVLTLWDALLHKAIITRPLEGFGLPHCLRISTGTMEQNRRCIAALRECLAETALALPSAL